MTVSGFLSKTFDIFSDPENEEICSWGVNGETIHVKKIDEFSKTILPKYFKHSNFQSFVRQLNMYDFHKTVQDPGNGEFTHVNFRKNRPDLLSLIKRKAHNKHELRAKQQQQQLRLNNMAEDMSGGSFATLEDGTPHPLASGSSSGATLPAHGDGSSDSVYMVALEQEQQKQKRIREDFEWRLSQLEAQKARIYELEAQQGRLSGENYMLKHMLQDSRVQQNELQNKMEGVLKLMYHAFVNSGSNGNAIGNGIPESRLMEFCNFLNVSGPPVLKLESGETLDANGGLSFGGSGSGSSSGSGDLPFPKNNAISNADLTDFLHNGDLSSDLITSPQKGGTHKRKVEEVEELVPSSQNDEVVDIYPKLEKVVSFDSLAGHIRPNSVKPPLSTSSSGNKASVGEYGINSPPQNLGVIPGPPGGGMLSRQHSLELPPPGQSISGGYHYTPLSTAHDVKKLKTEDMAAHGRMEGQGLTRAPSLSRQDSVESLGLPLGHMDSMDSTLASLFDISDQPDDQVD